MSKKSDADRLRLLLHKHYGGYENYIRRVIPKYEEIQAAVLNSIPFPRGKKLKVMELGLGTGETANRLLHEFPHIQVDAIEYSENMKKLATERLSKNKGRFEIFLADFTKVWPKKKYDLIFSTLAIHHVKEKEKTPLLKTIYQHLKKGGVFINGDMVMFDDKYLSKKAEEIYIGFLKAHLTHKEFLLFKKHVSAEDFPTPLESHLRHMEKIGFKQVSVIWRHFGFAVYSGKK